MAERQGSHRGRACAPALAATAGTTAATRWRPPVDLAEALDAIGQDVMAGYSPERAMREFLRRGGRDQAGLDDLARRVAERRRELLQRHHLDGTLQEVRELLDRAVLEERKQLARDVEMDDGDRAFREMQLDNLPPSTAAAVDRAGVVRLAEQRGARGLRADQGPARPRAARPALRRHEAGARERHRRGPGRGQRDARATSTTCSRSTSRARTPQQDFDDFMDKHGDFFPEDPQNIDELLDSLAQRSAAAQRMLNSMSAEQRAELMELSQQAFGSPAADGAAGPDGRQPAGAAPGRGLGRLGALRGRARGSGSATAPACCRTSPSSTSSPTSSRSPTAARGSTTSTSTRWPASSATRRRSTRGRCRSSSGRCATAATSTAAPTASCGSAQGDAPARQGAAARRRRADVGPAGPARAARTPGAAGEPSGATREWEFGDTEPWDVAAHDHQRASPDRGEGGDPRRGVRLEIDDVEVQETEARTQAAVALLVDTSFSMAMDGRWVPMKRTALALHTLVRSRFRGDALQLIAFGRHAQVMEIEELTGPRRPLGQGHQPPPRAAAGQPALPQAPQRPAGAAGRHRRRADLAPRARRRGALLLPAAPADDRLRRARARQRAAGWARRRRSSGSARTPGWRASSSRWRSRVDGRVVAPELDDLGAAVVGSYLGARARASSYREHFGDWFGGGRGFWVG